MVGSSISTYLDVTRAASGAAKSAAAQADPEATAQAAKVLAALYAGKEQLPELRDETGLDSTKVLSALTSLADAGLAELEDDGGGIRARLAEPARAALSAA
jgi:DNA-binding IclR family transcriptional regulator